MGRIRIKVGGREPGQGKRTPAGQDSPNADPLALYMRWGEMGANLAEMGKYGEDPATDFTIQRGELELLLHPFLTHENHLVRGYAQDMSTAILLNEKHTLDAELTRDREKLLGKLADLEANGVQELDKRDREQLVAIIRAKQHLIDRSLEACQYASIIHSMTLNPMHRSSGVMNAALRASDFYLFPDRHDVERLLSSSWGDLPGTPFVRKTGLLPRSDPANPDYERAAGAMLKMILEPMLTDFVVDIQENELSRKVARNLFDVSEEQAAAWLRRLEQEMKIESYAANFIGEDGLRGYGRDKSIEAYMGNDGQERIYANVKDAAFSLLEERDETAVRQTIGQLTRQLWLFRDSDVPKAHVLGVNPVNAAPILRVIGEYRGLPSKVVAKILEHDPFLNPSIGYVNPALRKG